MKTQRDKTPLLVTAEWLEKNLGRGDLRIIDCRWVLGKPGEGMRQFEEGHIPGAVHLDVDRDLSGKSGPGRHPIPNPQDFAATMNRIGVSSEIHVIAYDAGSGMPAPRLWWLLRYFGHERVSVLDGGWRLWVKEGRPSQSGPSPVLPLAVHPLPFTGEGQGEGFVVDKTHIQSHLNDPSVLLVDARAHERYRGDIEPIDKRAGHIPGAVNWPFASCVDEAGHYNAPPGPLSYIKRGGVQKEIICYCGSGITACTDIFALKLAGIDAKLYEGSWSDWSRDDSLPVAISKKV